MKSGWHAVRAQPFEYRFPMSHTALVMIDMQRDFIEPGGFGASLGNDIAQVAAIVPTAAALLGWARQHRLPIVHTKECHRPDLSDCPPAKRERGSPSLRIGDPGPMGRLLIDGEQGSDFVPQLAPWPGETILSKPGKGAFHATAFGEILRNWQISHLVLAGVTTEVCVQTTMREANDRGYECLMVEDATASYFPAFKQATLDMIRAQGAIVGWTATLAQLAEAVPAS
jgi:nicotinamidase-related amidase